MVLKVLVLEFEKKVKKLISTGHMLKNMQDKAETTHQANNFYKEVIGSYCCYRS
jgi:hypothetical protein